MKRGYRPDTHSAPTLDRPPLRLHGCSPAQHQGSASITTICQYPRRRRLKTVLRLARRRQHRTLPHSPSWWGLRGTAPDRRDRPRISLDPTAPTMSSSDASAPSSAATTVVTTAPTNAVPAAAAFPVALQRQPSTDGEDLSSQSHPQSTADSQDTTMTVSTDQAFTPPGSDPGTCPIGQSSQDSQLHQLSQIAAAQDRIATDGSSSRKRMADGEVKTRSESWSPVKGHTRGLSAAGKASTGGYLGEVRHPVLLGGCHVGYGSAFVRCSGSSSKC